MRFWKYISKVFFICFLFSHNTICFAGSEKESFFVCNDPELSNKYWSYLNDRVFLDDKTSYDEVDKIYNKFINDKDALQDKYDKKCMWIKSKSIRPFLSNYGTSLALTDGVRDIWFEHEASFGWINPQFYLYFVNRNAPN